MSSFLYGQTLPPIYNVNFDDDCGGVGCDPLQDLVADECVLTGNSNSKLKSLGGFNMITPTCMFEYGGGVFWSVPFGGNNPKLLIQEYGGLRLAGQPSTQNPFIGGKSRGVFLNMENGEIPYNYFFEYSFDMENIWQMFRCDAWQSPESPTIGVYLNEVSENSSGQFLNENFSNNLFVKNNSSQLLNQFRIAGPLFQVGNTYPASGDFEIFQPVYEEGGFYQFALFNDGKDLPCFGFGSPPDDDNHTNNSPQVDVWSAVLIDNLIIDCDKKNIVFTSTTELIAPDKLISCTNERLYEYRLYTDCPNVVFNNYLFNILVYDSNNQLVKTIAGSGERTLFSLDDLPSGTYKFVASYITSNGRNEKVKNGIFGSLEDYSISYVDHIQNGPYIITEDTEYNTDIYLPEDLHVAPGVTLTIHAGAYFNDDKQLLLMDGAQLITGPGSELSRCFNRWEGVNVPGAGTVSLRGGVSWAKNGVLSQSSAQIDCIRAVFENNLTGIKAYSSTMLNAENTTFLGNNEGAYLYNVDNISTFIGCDFNFHAQHGILSFGSPLDVKNNNTFFANSNGIVFRDLLGVSALSSIGTYTGTSGNFFNYNDRGIMSYGHENRLRGNSFEGNSIATMLVGQNILFSRENLYNDRNGEIVLGIGGNTSSSERNMYSCILGLNFTGNNNSYTFTENCFDSYLYDVRNFGTINDYQGSTSFAAANCFTATPIGADFISTQAITYYLPEDNPLKPYPDCFVPKNLNPNSFDNANDWRDPACGLSYTPGITSEYDYIRAMKCDTTKIKEYISFLISELFILEFTIGIPNLTRSQHLQRNWMRRHLNFASRQLMWCLRNIKRYPELFEFAKEQDDKEMALVAVEAKILMQEYEEAKVELGLFKESYGIENNIYSALLLNIDYVREDAPRREFNPQEIQLLRNVALMEDPLAAYGRNLLYLVTGESIEPPMNEDMEGFNGGPIEPRGKKMEILSMYPNPASHTVSLEIDHYDYESPYRVEISSFFGQAMTSQNALPVTTIETSHYPAGLYMVKVYKEGNLLFTKKLSVAK